MGTNPVSCAWPCQWCARATLHTLSLICQLVAPMKLMHKHIEATLLTPQLVYGDRSIRSAQTHLREVRGGCHVHKFNKISSYYEALTLLT